MTDHYQTAPDLRALPSNALLSATMKYLNLECLLTQTPEPFPAFYWKTSPTFPLLPSFPFPTFSCRWFRHAFERFRRGVVMARLMGCGLFAMTKRDAMRSVASTSLPPCFVFWCLWWAIPGGALKLHKVCLEIEPCVPI